MGSKAGVTVSRRVALVGCLEKVTSEQRPEERESRRPHCVGCADGGGGGEAPPGPHDAGTGRPSRQPPGKQLSCRVAFPGEQGAGPRRSQSRPVQGDDGSALSASLSQVRGWRRGQQLPEGAGNGIPWAVLPSLVRNPRSSGQRRAFAALRTANSPHPTTMI